MEPRLYLVLGPRWRSESAHEKEDHSRSDSICPQNWQKGQVRQIDNWKPTSVENYRLSL